jgi:hypothetical protein
MTDPDFAPEYYDMMNGIWKDGTRMIYGGNAHASSGGYGPACDFIFPGNSDSLNWGVGCNPPNGPVYWTEVTATNAPYDRRGVSSTGPVTFRPGDKQDIDIAFAWARDYTSSDPNASLIKLQGVVDNINKAFAENRLPDGTPIYGITNHAGKGESGFRIYPNPAKERITLEFEGTASGSSTVRIMNLQGRTVREIPVKGLQKLGIDVSDMEQGVYFVQVQSAQVVKTRKLILVK